MADRAPFWSARRVMVTGGGANGNGQTTALIGTMLDTMISREEDAKKP